MVITGPILCHPITIISFGETPQIRFPAISSVFIGDRSRKISLPSPLSDADCFALTLGIGYLGLICEYTHMMPALERLKGTVNQIEQHLSYCMNCLSTQQGYVWSSVCLNHISIYLLPSLSLPASLFLYISRYMIKFDTVVILFHYF